MASGGEGDESFSREEREDSWVAGLYQSDDEEELQQGTVNKIQRSLLNSYLWGPQNLVLIKKGLN